MSEFHDDGSTKAERYARDKHQVNQQFDHQLKNKSFFTFKRDIENSRKVALAQVESSYYGERKGGCFAIE